MALYCREGDSSYPVRVLATGDAFVQDAPKGPMLAEKEEEGMARSFRAGITHAGWLHKLVGKTPLDVHWKRYWVSDRTVPKARGNLYPLYGLQRTASQLRFQQRQITRNPLAHPTLRGCICMRMATHGSGI